MATEDDWGAEPEGAPADATQVEMARSRSAAQRRRLELMRRAHLVSAASESCREAQLLLQQLSESTVSLATSLQEFRQNSDDERRSQKVPSITVEPAKEGRASASTDTSARASVSSKRASLKMWGTQKLEAPPMAEEPLPTDMDISENEAVQLQRRRISFRAQPSTEGVGRRETRSRGSMPRPSLDMPTAAAAAVGFRRQKTDRTFSDMDRHRSIRTSGRRTEFFCRRTTRRGSSMRRPRATDVSDTGVEVDLSAINSSTSESDSSDFLSEDVPECEKKGRRGGVSAPASGMFNRRLAEHKLVDIQKPRELVEIIKNALIDFPPLVETDEEGLERLAMCMVLEEFEPGQTIVEQRTYGRSGYVIVDGEAEVLIDGCLKRTMTAGRFFGEFTMLFGFKRGATVKAKSNVTVAKLKRDNFFELVSRREMAARSVRENYLRNLRMFDTLGPEEIAKVADAMELVTFEKGQEIIRQGEYGDEMYLVLSGECQAECRVGKDDVQKHREYTAGDRFGEKAFIERAKRAATVRATTDCEVLRLRRSAFRRMMGNLDEIQQEHYMHDPRKTIADFYRYGDDRGPRGVSGEVSEDAPNKSEWFAIYRPTSRDAIAKMLSGRAVGKGLNVKGKSSKKNHLSGFVPFLQISEDRHKAEIEDSPADARVTVFYQSDEARSNARRAFQALLDEDEEEDTLELRGPRTIEEDNSYPNVFGLIVHERLLRQVYIVRPPLAHTVGWETGRPSVPAFMDMNLHAIRDVTLPKVVLYQFDGENALNPHGLLIAYAETHVKPVVSDFDTFTVGSKGFKYATLSPDQQKLALQTLKHTDAILSSHKTNWSSAWIDILKQLPHDAMPAIPKYGFGDATSTMLIEAVITATSESGAVRHGAECFNFGFPQELDEEFLIIYEKFDDKPWRSTDLSGLRHFLLERAKEGYSFPLNPVWPVRDKGWYKIYLALRDSPTNAGVFNAWYPPESGIAEMIEEMHARYPHGFSVNTCPETFQKKDTELDGYERADYEQRNMSKNWRRLRGAVTLMKLGTKPNLDACSTQVGDEYDDE